jgi:hypothetical protein
VCLLKDVFDYTLEEIAKLLDSTVGSVKAALNRGWSKLAALPEQRTPPQKKDAEMSKLFHLYVERFHRRRRLPASGGQIRRPSGRVTVLGQLEPSCKSF